MIKNNNTFIKKKDDGKQNIHNTAKNINHHTVIAGRPGEIIIKMGEKDNKTPMGVDNTIVFKGSEDQNKKNNNHIMIEEQQSKRKSLIEKIKDWFSSWSCSCNCNSCIDDESEINLESNVDKPRNITPGEW